MDKPQDKTILIVDDEEDVREYFATVLKDVGFNVMTAADGNKALDMVKQKKPDYISLDLVMPNKSGYKFIRELRKNREWATIPFVIVTAHASDDLGRDELQNIFRDKTFSGPGIYLEKPVMPEDYLNFICQELKVECHTKPRKEEASQIRSEVDSLLQQADPDTLRQILKLLNEKT